MLYGLVQSMVYCFDCDGKFIGYVMDFSVIMWDMVDLLVGIDILVIDCL